ncbi:MAG: family zinc transporter [Ramlibacter sp.]|jgi:ZIP family zinc transporter|nr:family zinc transporter [Ramlibacter sp.]
MPTWAMAGIWGGVAGSALLIGAMIGFFARVPQRLIAAVMAFGSGVLVSAVSFDLMEVAWKRGGFASTAAGFIGGAAVYTAANVYLSRRGARHRKRSQGLQASEKDKEGSGVAIAIGALLDGIPESMVIGISMLEGTGVSAVVVAAIFLSNIPEGLSSAAGMKNAGRGVGYAMGVWGGIALASAVAALVGYTLFRDVPQEVVAATMAVAAGAILAMIADTLIPEAFAEAHDYTGLVTVAGFLTAFALEKLAV